MSDPPTPRSSAVLALAALTGINLFNYLDRQILPAVLVPLKAEMGWSDSRLGTVAIAFMLGYFLTAPFFGFLGDRLSRKWLIALGVGVWSLGTILSGRAHGFGEMILYRVLVGLGEASYGTISPAWIADLYSARRRNTALSIFYVAIPVGSALGYLVGGAVAAHWGWRSAFLWAGVPGFALAVGMLALREPARGQNEDDEGRARRPVAPSRTGGPGRPALPGEAEGGRRPPGDGGSAGDGERRRPEADAHLRTAVRSYLSLLQFPDYVLVVAGYVAQTFALGGFAIWAPTFLYRVHGMAMAQADRFFGLSLVLTGLSATLLGGLTATAWRRRSPAGYAAVLALSAAMAAPAAAGAFLLPSLAMAKASLIAAMFLLFLPTGPINTLILESVPVGARATAMAASIFAIHFLGDLWSPKIVGILSDRWGDLRQASVACLPPAVAVSAVFWVWLALRQRRSA